MASPPDRADTRTRILDAAERLLGRYGYKKMTMEDLATAAGLGRRTIYAHFGSKEDLALASLDRTIDLLVEELRGLARGSGPPADRLHRMLVGRILFLFDREQAYSHALDEMYAAIRSRYKAHREKYVRAEAEVFAKVISEGEKAGAFEVDDPDEVAHALIWATSTLTPFTLNPRELGAREVVARRIQRIAGLLLRGLLRRAGEPATGPGRLERQ
jgi:AcrR family transcriptional regulator